MTTVEEFIRIYKVHPLETRFSIAVLVREDSMVRAVKTGNLEALVPLCNEWGELKSWLSNDERRPPTEDQIIDLVQEKRDDGWSKDTIGVYLKGLRSRPHRRPRSNRRIVMLALEKKQMQPELSWMQIAIKFCRCGKEQHVDHCSDRLRIRTLQLCKIINALGV